MIADEAFSSCSTELIPFTMFQYGDKRIILLSGLFHCSVISSPLIDVYWNGILMKNLHGKLLNELRSQERDKCSLKTISNCGKSFYCINMGRFVWDIVPQCVSLKWCGGTHKPQRLKEPPGDVNLELFPIKLSTTVSIDKWWQRQWFDWYIKIDLWAFSVNWQVWRKCSEPAQLRTVKTY
jgi:hypothetical protein